MIKNVDKTLVIITILLVSVGIVMVYSATSIMCAKTDWMGGSAYYLKKELFRVALGSVLMIIAAKIDYRHYKRISWLLLSGTGLLLIATAIPNLAGDSVKGATRWLDIGGGSFQPSEFIKIALIIYLAEYLAKKGKILDRFWGGFAVAVIVVGAIATIVALQPNYGMAIAIIMVSAIMFFVAGVPVKFLAYIGLPSVAALTFAIMHSDHAHRRIVTFIQGGDLLDAGFQINQSLIALGTGGMIGKGIGNGVQKLFYVPEIHTDFIFAVIGEELGFIGAVGVLALFLLFSWRGLKIAMRSPDGYGCYLAIGLTAMIFVNAALNIGVVLRLLPTTGIPLPFISYGGSSLVVAMISCGILFNISSHATRPLKSDLVVVENPIGGLDENNYSRWRHRGTLDPGAEHSAGASVSPSGH